MDASKPVARRITENPVAKRAAFFLAEGSGVNQGDTVRPTAGDDLPVVELMRRSLHGVSMTEK